MTVDVALGDRGYPNTAKMVSTRWQHHPKPAITAAFEAFGRFEKPHGTVNDWDGTDLMRG